MQENSLAGTGTRLFYILRIACFGFLFKNTGQKSIRNWGVQLQLLGWYLALSKHLYLFIYLFIHSFIYLFSFFPVGRGSLLQVSPITAGPV